MAEIGIHRTKFYVGIARKIVIKIDGERVGSVAFGKTEVFDVSVGTHRVEVSMDWISDSIDVVVGEYALVEVNCTNFPMAIINTFIAPHKVLSLHSDFAVPPSPTNYPR